MGGNCTKVERTSVNSISRKRSTRENGNAQNQQNKEDSRRELRKPTKTNGVTASEDTSQLQKVDSCDDTSTTTKTKRMQSKGEQDEGYHQQMSSSSTTSKRKTAVEKSKSESINSKIRNEVNEDNSALTRIEQQRLKSEMIVKERLLDLNLEKHTTNSIFQLLKDFLSHVKNTKKYWISMRLLGHSKSEMGESAVGGSLSVGVEFNTGEMTRLRVVHSRDMEKCNFDVDTFVVFSKLQHQSLVSVQDFNLRISPKFLRYYIFSESAYHETSLAQMIAVQAKTDKPCMTGTSFTNMFNDLLGLLTYFSQVRFTHGGLTPQNIFITKQLQTDGRLAQRAILDISLSNNAYNRRSSKFKEFAFRKSNDLQMFAISMLSLLSSMDIHAIESANRKSIINSKLSASSLIKVGNDVRYALSCILRGSDMILEFGAGEMQTAMKNSHRFENLIGLARSSQQKNSFSFCCNFSSSSSSDIAVYSFYTKWAFGFRVYEAIELNRLVKVKKHYCSGDFLYLIFECEGDGNSSRRDTYLTRIDLKKKCLENKLLSLIKSLAVALCKFQDVKTEEEIDIMRAFESFDIADQGFIDSDCIKQFALENKIKDVMSCQQSDVASIVSSFDESDQGRLTFYEFKNMLQYIMPSRPLMSLEVKDTERLPRYYNPASIIKKANYLYLIGGTYLNQPTNKCFRYFLKNLSEPVQEVAQLEAPATKGFLLEPEDSGGGNKLVFWSWPANAAASGADDSQKSSARRETANDLKLRGTTNSSNSGGVNGKDLLLSSSTPTSSRRMSQQLRTMSLAANLDVDVDSDRSNNFFMNVLNVDKNKWIRIALAPNEILDVSNHFFPLVGSGGQVLVFDGNNTQHAWLMRVTLSDISFPQKRRLFFTDKSAVDEILAAAAGTGSGTASFNVLFYENALLFLRKSPSGISDFTRSISSSLLAPSFDYCAFVINEETGVVTLQSFPLISYLASYERVSKTINRFESSKKSSNTMANSSSLSRGGGGGNLKMKIGRYTADKLLCGFGETMMFSAYRPSMPGVEVRILSRVINNVTEKIDDIYETIKFLTNHKLGGRIPTLRDSFFIFDPNAAHIKINLLYTNEDTGLSMWQIMQNIIADRDQARALHLQEKIAMSKSHRFNHPSKSNKQEELEDKEEEVAGTNKENAPAVEGPSSLSQTLMKSKTSRKSFRGNFLSGSGGIESAASKRQASGSSQLEFPSRLFELLASLRNVLICMHYMQQQKFYLKEVSPHTLVKVREGKYFAPINFYHESTFTTVHSENFEPIVSRESAAFEEYLSPQLRKAHVEGKSMSEVSYNIHKANIFSIGLVFLHYAGLSRKPVPVTGVDAAAQLRLSKVINALPFPKYVHDFLGSMLRFSEDERPNAARLLDTLQQIFEDNRMQICFPQILEGSSAVTSSNKKQVVKKKKDQKKKNEDCQFFVLEKSQLLMRTLKGGVGEYKTVFNFVDSASIIGIVRSKEDSFICLIRYVSEASEQMPQVQFKYMLARLLKNSQKMILQGKPLGLISVFTGREITSVNLLSVDASRVLICAGTENTSIGVMDMREVYMCQDLPSSSESNHQSHAISLEHHFASVTRLDDLKEPVRNAHLLKFDANSHNHRRFDPSSALDGNEPTILERSEEEENDDDDMYDRIQAVSQEVSEDEDDDEEEEEEEEQKEDTFSASPPSNAVALQLSRAAADKRPKKLKSFGFFVIDQACRSQVQSSGGDFDFDFSSMSTSTKKKKGGSDHSVNKCRVKVQVISSSGSIEARSIGLKAATRLNGSEGEQEAEGEEVRERLAGFLQYVVLSDSLVVGIDLVSGDSTNPEITAYLISLLSFKSHKLQVVYEEEDEEGEEGEVKRQKKLELIGSVEGMSYTALSERKFELVFEVNGNLCSQTFEVDLNLLRVQVAKRQVLLQKQQPPSIGASANSKQMLIDGKKKVQASRILLPSFTVELDQVREAGGGGGGERSPKVKGEDEGKSMSAAWKGSSNNNNSLKKKGSVFGTGVQQFYRGGGGREPTDVSERDDEESERERGAKRGGGGFMKSKRNLTRENLAAGTSSTSEEESGGDGSRQICSMKKKSKRKQVSLHGKGVNADIMNGGYLSEQNQRKGRKESQDPSPISNIGSTNSGNSSETHLKKRRQRQTSEDTSQENSPTSSQPHYLRRSAEGEATMFIPGGDFHQHVQSSKRRGLSRDEVMTAEEAEEEDESAKMIHAGKKTGSSRNVDISFNLYSDSSTHVRSTSQQIIAPLRQNEGSISRQSSAGPAGEGGGDPAGDDFFFQDDFNLLGLTTGNNQNNSSRFITGGVDHSFIKDSHEGGGILMIDDEEDY